MVDSLKNSKKGKIALIVGGGHSAGSFDFDSIDRTNTDIISLEYLQLL